jgi:hypothetical protein
MQLGLDLRFYAIRIVASFGVLVVNCKMLSGTCCLVPRIVTQIEMKTDMLPITSKAVIPLGLLYKTYYHTAP